MYIVGFPPSAPTITKIVSNSTIIAPTKYLPVPSAHSQCPVPTVNARSPQSMPSAHTQCQYPHSMPSPQCPTASSNAHSQCQCPHGQCPVPTRSVPRVRSVRARPEHCNTYCMQIETPHLLVFVVQVSGLCSVYPFRLQPLCVSPKPVWKSGGKTVKPPTKEASLCTPHQRVPTDGDIVFTRR